jgi:creatinine amidohydrolase
VRSPARIQRVTEVFIAELNTAALKELLDAGAVVALLPVGSVEPHGPHLPLGTDTMISQGVAARACEQLNASGVTTLIAPAVPYGVTDYAAGFAGAISIAADVLTPFLRAVVDGYLKDGFAHVCLINNHLEPDHDRAVRAAIEGVDAGRASVACPLTRRWGRTLSDEYKSGACHAGRYETSLVLATRPETVAADKAARLPALDTSLSDGMKSGLTTFAAMGLDAAYTGAPAEATAAEGDDLLNRLATMVVTEVNEALASI